MAYTWGDQGLALWAPNSETDLVGISELTGLNMEKVLNRLMYKVRMPV